MENEEIKKAREKMIEKMSSWMLDIAQKERDKVIVAQNTIFLFFLGIVTGITVSLFASSALLFLQISPMYVFFASSIVLVILLFFVRRAYLHLKWGEKAVDSLLDGETRNYLSEKVLDHTIEQETKKREKQNEQKSEGRDS